MRISDWSSDVCSSDLSLPCKPDGLLATNITHAINRVGEVIGNQHRAVTGLDHVHRSAEGFLAIEKSLDERRDRTHLAIRHLHALDRVAALFGSVPTAVQRDERIAAILGREQIGRASCRERVCQYV